MWQRKEGRKEGRRRGKKGEGLKEPLGRSDEIKNIFLALLVFAHRLPKLITAALRQGVVAERGIRSKPGGSKRKAKIMCQSKLMVTCGSSFSCCLQFKMHTSEKSKCRFFL